MKVEYGNGWYFFYIILAIAFFIGTYFLLKRFSPKTQKTVLIVLAFLNLAYHFLKFFGSVYYGTVKGYRELFFITLCSSTIAFTPFALLSKSAAFKDYVYYIGVGGGIMALLIPTEALGGDPFCFLSVRFYTQHILLAAIPMLFVALGLHEVSYRRIWKMPFFAIGAYMFIIVNHVLAYELGFMGVHDNFLHARFFNPSLVWGPTDPLANAVKVFTPDFMKTVPIGEYAGQEKYWPLLWLTPAIFLLMLAGPAVYCLIFDFDEVRSDAVRLRLRRMTKGLSDTEVFQIEVPATNTERAD